MQLKNANILVIDDDPDVLTALRIMLKSLVSNVVTEKNPNNITALLEREKFDVIILDMNFNGVVNTGNEGIFWLNKIKQIDKRVDVILITAYADIDLAIRSLKKGASDFLVKPWKNQKMIEALKSLVEKKSVKPQLSRPTAAGNKIIGESEEMQSVFEKLRKVAPTDANILILGENGTGKELIARAIHRNSRRSRIYY